LMGITMADSKEGVLIKSVVAHGSAIKAGILKGDVIVEIDGQKIKSSSDVKLWGFDKKPNMIVELKLRRKNKMLIKKLKLTAKAIVSNFQKH
ncbi:MAG: PDZ domain-containing protein, partial [Bacteroidales bacterium]|nr:PDZ domain-containing protein [Bacteroidales bacterium]